MSGLYQTLKTEEALLLTKGIKLSFDSECVCVIGAFDGVHLGHKKLIEDARREANVRALPLVLVTFDPDPSDIILGCLPLSRLLSTADRLDLLMKTDIDAIICLNFTKDFAQLSWKNFALKILQHYFCPRAVFVGSNFHFGKGGAGTVELLAELGTEQGFDVYSHELIVKDGDVISATRIRSLIRKGDIQAATSLLGRRPFVKGVVVHGRGQGKHLGFPTANIEVDPFICMPKQAVYAAYVLYDKICYPAAVNVSYPPTFTSKTNPSFLEVTLIDFEGDLYGRELKVVFDCPLRQTKTFSTTAQLISCVKENIEWVKEHLSEAAYNQGEECS